MDLGSFLSRADATFQSIATYLNALVVALVIFFAGVIIARLVGMVLGKAFLALDLDAALARAFGRRHQYARGIRSATVRALYLVTVYLALRSLHLAGVAIGLIVGVAILIILVSFFISAIELVPNLVARSRLRARRINVGDEVEVDHPSGRIAGRITDVGPIETQLRRPGGDIVFFPNASLLGVRIVKRHVRK